MAEQGTDTRGRHARARGAMSGSRWYRALALLPALGLLGGVPGANRVHAYVLGLPFLLFWIVAWVLLTSVLLGIVAFLDWRWERNGAGAGPDPRGSDTP